MATKIIIGALSCKQYPERQNRCRHSWMADARRKGIDCVFLIGDPSVKEPTRDGDMLLLPCPSDYPSLPQRTRWFCKWLLTQDFQYALKLDDDTLVCIDRLAKYDFAGRDYIGAEWNPGVGYGSGGAGYFMSRKAVEIIANHMTHSTGSEDLLVGATLRSHGIPFSLEPRLVPYGNGMGGRRWPLQGNDFITSHAVSGQCAQESYEATGYWRSRIAMMCSNKYAKAAGASIQLLKKYWPDHPRLDVLHYEQAPPAFAQEDERVNRINVGAQASLSWTDTLKKYLVEHNTDDSVFLMLDDYALCAPVRSDMLELAHETMRKDSRIGNIHLTWLPPDHAKTPYSPGIVKVGPWAYSVCLQAAIWRRELLLQLLTALGSTTAEDFELSGSRLFNHQYADKWLHCSIDIPRPHDASGFVDGTDKSQWALKYNNIYRRGVADPRHTDFLKSEGFTLS